MRQRYIGQETMQCTFEDGTQLVLTEAQIAEINEDITTDAMRLRVETVKKIKKLKDLIHFEDPISDENQEMIDVITEHLDDIAWDLG